MLVKLVPITISAILMQSTLVAGQDTENPTAVVPSPEWRTGPGHWHMWGEHSGWHMWWSPLWIMAFFILLIILVRYLRLGRRWHRVHRRPHDPTASAIEILNERFAKGEIQEAEFDARRAKLLAT